MMKKYILTFVLALLSFTSASAVSYKVGQAVVTKEGDMGVVFFVAQNKVLLVSINEAKTVWGPDAVGKFVCWHQTLDEVPYAWNGKEFTKEMLASGISFPVLDSIPTDRNWYLPSYAEAMMLQMVSKEVNETLTKIGGTVLNNAIWTCTEYDENWVRLADCTVNHSVFGQTSDPYLVSSFIYSRKNDMVRTVRAIYQIDLDEEQDLKQAAYVWNTGSSEKVITVNPTKTTTYSVSAKSLRTACVNSVSHTVVVADDGVQEIYDTICAGETYSKYGFNFTEPETGVYSSTVSSGSCTAGINLHLYVGQSYREEYNDNVCLGEYYGGHGFSITPFVKGSFTDSLTFLTKSGCDSVVVVKLNVKPLSYDTVTGRVCQNEVYSDPDFNIPAQQKAGLNYYTVEKVGSNGCKLFRTLILRVDSTYQASVVDDVMAGSDYNRHGFSLRDVEGEGPYDLNLQTVSGCDSIITLKLNVHQPADMHVVPTVFSPENADGNNDIFMKGYDVYIYDRYGNLICHSADGWNGYYRGKFADAGVYVYVITMKDGTKRKGSIEVLKN